MSKKSTVPDAWDDDYEAIADSKQAVEPAYVDPVKISRAERRAKHAEANKQLWESAENPETFQFVEARNDLPLKSEFKPAMKVLSRKPKLTDNTLSPGVDGMAIQDDGEDSEQERQREEQASFAEKQRKAQLEREEKQRRYHEVRERLFGSPTPSADAPVGHNTPTKENSGGTKPSRGNRKGGSGARGSSNNSSAEQSPARPASQARKLYDPNYTEKPGSVFVQKRDSSTSDTKMEGPAEGHPIRAPRGPDGSGRGGFGFAPRG